MLTTLKARYSDDVLAKMFEAGKKVTQSNSVATKLQTQQMENWMAAKNMPNDVFKILLLDKAGNAILDNPMLSIWTNCMRFFNAKPENRKNQVTLVATLTAHYKDGGVLGIIEAAKKVPNTATAAKRLEADQIQLRLKNGRTPDELLTLLSLDKAGDQLLASPRFQTWSKFINYYNKENPGDATTVMEKLAYHLGDEEIMRILEAARKVPSTEKAATKLQTEQFKTWLNADKIPDDVFKLLQLNKAGDVLLANPQFKYWGKYVEDLNLKPVNNGRQVFIIDVLRDNFADDVLAKMILAGMKVPATKNMAQRMENELFKVWVVNGKTPDVIFMYLNLHKAEESVFQSPLWSMYTKFLEEYNKVFPMRQTTMISAFARSYDKEALAKLLVAAKKVPSTEKLATKLQTDQIQRWLDNKDSPNRIFKALRLDDVVDDVLTSPLFNTWATYLDTFNVKFPSEKVPMIDTFRASFDNKSLAKMLITAQEIPTMEKLATKLQADQLQRWLAKKDSPEDIFRALVLDDAVDDVLSNPLLNTWASYLEDFNAKFPRSKVSMVDTFREFFGDKTLVKMLIAAKKVESTKKIASDLETSLINKWIHAKKIPAVVSKLLGADDGSVKLLRAYTAKYMKTYGS
ncbi:hypothetical protein JG688_00014659 [Phytophthora aleatoria]|uniref:RxLR effector PexRD54 WY domain-containing protein n=1 Tax=Phytophthora aleatoria TaxID=2496075 RepID=A0A8J5MDU8_9STRA|nr:hypothetical protein JG688_00014659 [Phytophthora aleatoria]